MSDLQSTVMQHSITMSSSIGHSFSLHDFYKDKTIFLTGSTGFLGHVIVEKILRSFPEIKKLFLIIRSKNGKSSKERISEYFDNKIFAGLKREDPTAIAKVQGLEGDVALDYCGLSEDSIKMIQEEVNIVLHCAATVNFTQPLRAAVTINVKGTFNILTLSKDIKFLQSLVYVSTAFSNCNKKVLEEDIYPHPISAEKLMELVELLDEDSLDCITPSLLGGWPNTYTYTKNASENLVHSFRHQMPVSIFRPGIITATSAEPVPQWINKFIGPYGYMTATGLGYNRVVHCSELHMNSNLVPCDFVANAIIAVACDVGIERKYGFKIYNYTADKNPISWLDFSTKILSGYEKTPFTKAIWHPVSWFIANRWHYEFLEFFLHKCPTFFIDLPARLTNRKGRYGAAMKKITKNLDVVAHFLNNDLLLKSENVYRIWDKLSEDEKSLINFDMRSLNWDLYFDDAMRGIKQYLLKEDMSEQALHRAKVKCFWLYILHRIFKTGLLATLFCILRYIYKRTK